MLKDEVRRSNVKVTIAHFCGRHGTAWQVAYVSSLASLLLPELLQVGAHFQKVSLR